MNVTTISDVPAIAASVVNGTTISDVPAIAASVVNGTTFSDVSAIAASMVVNGTTISDVPAIATSVFTTLVYAAGSFSTHPPQYMVSHRKGSLLWSVFQVLKIVGLLER